MRIKYGNVKVKTKGRHELVITTAEVRDGIWNTSITDPSGRLNGRKLSGFNNSPVVGQTIVTNYTPEEVDMTRDNFKRIIAGSELG